VYRAGEGVGNAMSPSGSARERASVSTISETQGEHLFAAASAVVIVVIVSTSSTSTAGVRDLGRRPAGGGVHVWRSGPAVTTAVQQDGGDGGHDAVGFVVDAVGERCVGDVDGGGDGAYISGTGTDGVGVGRTDVEADDAMMTYVFCSFTFRCCSLFVRLLPVVFVLD
jgi:hypothetical protein